MIFLQSNLVNYWFLIGRFWGDATFSRIEYWKHKNGDYTLRGSISDQYYFNINTNLKKKDLFMQWGSQEFTYDRSIELKATPKNGAGSCAGTMFYQTTLMGKYKCQTSGSLEDAFFTSPQDILSWIVHLTILPDGKRYSFQLLNVIPNEELLLKH